MTAVSYNREGIDVVELKITTTGTNKSHFTAQDVILNSSLDYIFGITSLNVDCSDLPIFPPATNNVFLTIKKRRVGQALDATLPDADVSATFSVTPQSRRYFDVSTFIAALSTFANTFSQLQDAAGIVPVNHGGGQGTVPGEMANDGTQFLKIGIDAGGRLKFEGVSFFWNHFVIMLSDYAISLFQAQDIIQKVGDDKFPFIGITTTGAGAAAVETANGLLHNGVIRAGGNLVRSTLIARGSILKYLDHRLYITVETHLQTTKGLKVLNGEEKTDRSLIRIPFDNQATSTIFSQENRVVDNIELTTKSYVGRVSFVDKSHPIRQWNTLTSSYEQRIFRFQLYCVYMEFANGAFSQKKRDVPFSSLGEWNMTIRFVNKL